MKENKSETDSHATISDSLSLRIAMATLKRDYSVSLTRHYERFIVPRKSKQENT